MPVMRMNHAVLYVRDVEATTAFYTDVLGFRVKAAFPGARFLLAPGSANDHDLGLFEVGSAAASSAAGRGSVGLYHLAWEVDTLAELHRLAGALQAAGALVGASDHGTTKSLYAQDPDGLEMEICWVVPAAALTGDDQVVTRALDLPATLERYGAQTVGGLSPFGPREPSRV